MNTIVLDTSIYYSKELIFLNIYYNESALSIVYENNKISKSEMYNDVNLINDTSFISDLTLLDDDEFFQLSTVWDYVIPIELTRAIQKNVSYILASYKPDLKRFKAFTFEY